jgi:CDP-glucose 4,6-dehydratase
MEHQVKSIIGDIRNFDKIDAVIAEFQPEIVFHLAAQPIVRESYKRPRYTYETNVMGTVNVCEAIRLHSCVQSFLNVTTDKVYHNNEWVWGYRENEPLDGWDPYSNSKSCSELVTHAYINSFFNDMGVAVSTARAGNVIGGGDFAADRIIPDCIRAAANGQTLTIRNPYSTRPYQHVLEPLFTYLMIAEKQAQDKKYAGFYNVGPDECDCITTGALVRLFEKYWNQDCTSTTFNLKTNHNPDALHEANLLKLDCSKIKATFGWRPTWHIDNAVQKTVEWAKTWVSYASDTKVMNEIMEQQIYQFENDEDTIDARR